MNSSKTISLSSSTIVTITNHKSDSASPQTVTFIELLTHKICLRWNDLLLQEICS